MIGVIICFETNIVHPFGLQIRLRSACFAFRCSGLIGIPVRVRIVQAAASRTSIVEA